MIKDNKIILIVLSIFTLAVGVGALSLILKNDEELMPIDENIISVLEEKIEVYDKKYLKDIIEVNDGIILEDDYLIDTNKLGKIQLEVTYKEKGKTKKGYIETNIVDTTPPYVAMGDHYSHIIGTTFTFEKDIICADNYDKNIKCEIIGDYDLNTLGNTELKLIARDSSGNVTAKNFELRVIEKTDSVIRKTYKSLDIIKKNLPQNASIMIDVSKWQKDIDWKQVKEQGIEYAMLRIGTQRAIDKESVIDSYFEQNIKAAHENGIKVGVYYYSYANDIEDAKEQAEWVVETLKGYDLELPVAFDWECFKYFNDFNISLHDLNEIARTFLEIISKNGYDTINYGSKNYLENMWSLDDYKTWLAHYTDKTTYSKEYFMWQFTDSGLIPGISGAVDVNYLYNK